MWSISKRASLGVNLKRSLFNTVKSALLTLLAALLVVLSVSQTTLADTAAPAADWQNLSISFNGNVYRGPNEADTIKALGLPKDTLVWSYVDDVPSATSTNGGGVNAPPRLMHIIYFPAGSDLTKTSSAIYQEFTYVSNSSFTNPSKTTAISIDPSGYNTGTSSCALDIGMSWIICPVTDFLASAMDNLYTAISGFLAVQPLQTGSDNALYRTWSYMRDIANVCFIIAFMLIVLSYVTSFGISNYNLKKMLPRLIVAALFVNLSYFVCSLAIDLSNILGYSLQGIFENIRKAVSAGTTWDLSQTMSWKSVSSFLLSGGTLAAAGLAGAWLTVSGVGSGVIFIFLPVIIGTVLAGVVAFFIMAARQAIIFILVILSPLAFVAYLLPNTERWFKRWHELGMTMLIMFPMVSILFSGAQLAGTVIIMNADTINLIILGMMVMVIPLFATPFLIQFSGSFLGRVAGIVNNPNKGIIDRTRKWADYRADNMRQRRLGDSKMAKNGKGAAWWQFGRRTTQFLDKQKRTLDGKAGVAKAQADARWSNSRRYSGIYSGNRLANERKQIGEWAVEKLYEDDRLAKPAYTNYGGQNMLHDDAMHLSEANLKVSKAKVELHHEQHKAPALQSRGLQLKSLETQIEAVKAEGAKKLANMASESFKATSDYASMPTAMQGYVDDMRDAIRKTTFEGMAKTNADNIFKEDIFKALQASPALRDLAGNSDIDPEYGARRAEAAAFVALNKIREERNSNNVTLIENQAELQGTTSNSLVKSMLGTKGDKANGIKPNLIQPSQVNNLDNDQFEAAMEIMGKAGEVTLFEEAKSKLSGEKLAIVNRVIARNFGVFAGKNALHVATRIQDTPMTAAQTGAQRIDALLGTDADAYNNFKGSWFDNLADWDISSAISGSLSEVGDASHIGAAYDNLIEVLGDPGTRKKVSSKIPALKKIADALYAHPINAGKISPDDALKKQ